jgi:hypothetical protein
MVLPNFVISNFINAQVLDGKIDWAKESIGQCLLISFNSKFNFSSLNQKTSSKEI